MKWIAVVAVAVLAACVCADDIRFKDKVVLVTGGTSGIGYQTALQFAQEGAKVVICARDSQPDHYSGDKAVTDIMNDETVKANGGSVRFVKTDVRVEDEVKALFEDIMNTEKTLDIAINNAGISGPKGDLLSTTQYTDYDPIENNVYGVIRCIAEEEAIMMANNINGSIVNVAGVNGVTPNARYPRLSAAEYAIIGLGKSVALQHITGMDGPYIRVNQVLPGTIATPFTFNTVKEGQQPWEGDWITEDSDVWKNAIPEVVKHIPMQRVGRPEEVAKTILWLCTEEAEFISGDNILVDGGVWAV